MGKLKRLAFFLREYFFRSGCPVCGASCMSVDEAWYGLCNGCRRRIEQELAQTQALEACEYCGKPLISEQGRCLYCRRTEDRAFDRAIVLFPYAGKYRKLLASYKFDKHIALGNFFAEKIIKILEQKNIPPEAAIVPVPPRPGKLRKTGWDQVEYLARLLEKRRDNYGFPVSRCLKRLRSKSQKELGRENRQTNIRGRIIPQKQIPKTAVVIDDVMTTGSTLDACACALKEGGAQTVYGLCLFYD
ncbi:MAG: ComF family protein [Treponema sp.]|jgi:ComF family protein|nr:ComF family protein [Treponema sp.]